MKAGELYILRATIHPPQVRVLNVRDGAVQYVYTYGGMPGEVHETTYRGFGMLFKRDKREQNVIAPPASPRPQSGSEPNSCPSTPPPADGASG